MTFGIPPGVRYHRVTGCSPGQAVTVHSAIGLWNRCHFFARRVPFALPLSYSQYCHGAAMTPVPASTRVNCAVILLPPPRNLLRRRYYRIVPAIWWWTRTCSDVRIFLVRTRGLARLGWTVASRCRRCVTLYTTYYLPAYTCRLFPTYLIALSLVSAG